MPDAAYKDDNGGMKKLVIFYDAAAFGIFKDLAADVDRLLALLRSEQAAWAQDRTRFTWDDVMKMNQMSIALREMLMGLRDERTARWRGAPALWAMM